VLERLGTLAARHSARVILAWVVVLIVVGGLAKTHGGSPRDIPSIPGSSAQTGFDLLREHASSLAGATAQIVVQAPPGGTLRTPQAQAAVQQVIANVQGLPGVAAGRVSDPYQNPASRLFPTLKPGQDIPGTQLPVDRVLPSTISPDGTIALITVEYTQALFEVPPSSFIALQRAAAPAQQAGLTVAFGGKLVDALNAPPAGISKYADQIGVLCAVIILLISLGSVTGMLVPISLALFSLSISNSLTALAERVVNIGTLGPLLGTMMGLGVGIDYSLFVVSRYRQNLAARMEPRAAAGRAIGTAGSAVLFAGSTVCLALCGLALIGIPYIGQLVAAPVARPGAPPDQRGVAPPSSAPRRRPTEPGVGNFSSRGGEIWIPVDSVFHGSARGRHVPR